MNVSGDAAEQTFRLVIDGTEFIGRITGSLIKETLTMLYAISKDKEQSSIGKTNLAKMLRNCKDTKLFAIQRKDLNKFVQEAKNYGIYYCTLINKKDKSDDSIVDIMVRGDDASRVNRIVERFALAITDTASLRTESIKEKETQVTEDKKTIETEEKEIVDDNKLDDIMGRVKVLDEDIKNDESENFLSQQEEVPLGISSENKKEELTVKTENKKSVREQLKELANEIKNKPNKEHLERTKGKKSKKNKKMEVKRNAKSR